MGLAFTIRADGLDQIERKLAKLQAQLGDLSPLMSVIGQYLSESNRIGFLDGKGPDGKPWKPSIRVQLMGGQTMLDGGNLQKSIHSEHGRNFVAVGTNDHRAPMLHFGGRIVPKAGKALAFQLPGGQAVTVKSVTIPARPFLGVSSDDEVQIGEIVYDYLRDATREP